ncbi:hypothetical protein GJAV_G00223000 [Gymnothorax javanicus]|nr:hypothetical protein GJAV_G00223000 [Gymnothorax javanicus]
MVSLYSCVYIGIEWLVPGKLPFCSGSPVIPLFFVCQSAPILPEDILEVLTSKELLVPKLYQTIIARIWEIGVNRLYAGCVHLGAPIQFNLHSFLDGGWAFFYIVTKYIWGKNHKFSLKRRKIVFRIRCAISVLQLEVQLVRLADIYSQALQNSMRTSLLPPAGELKSNHRAPLCVTSITESLGRGLISRT